MFRILVFHYLASYITMANGSLYLRRLLTGVPLAPQQGVEPPLTYILRRMLAPKATSSCLTSVAAWCNYHCVSMTKEQAEGVEANLWQQDVIAAVGWHSTVQVKAHQMGNGQHACISLL